MDRGNSSLPPQTIRGQKIQVIFARWAIVVAVGPSVALHGVQRKLQVSQWERQRGLGLRPGGRGWSEGLADEIAFIKGPGAFIEFNWFFLVYGS